MGSYTLRRIVEIVITMAVMSVVVFLTIHMLPGSAAEFMLQDERSPEKIAALKAELGLDRPLHEQYGSWVSSLLRGDLGTSFVTGRPVGSDLAHRLPATLQLTLAATALALVLSIPAGIISAVKANSRLDIGVRSVALAGQSIPSFWLAIIMVLIFSVRLGVVPSNGYVPFATSPWDSLRHLILPASTLAFGMAAVVTRMVRSAVLEVMHEDFVRTAHSKGLGHGRVLFKHVLRNALVPIITVIGLQMGYMLGGSVIVEQMFSWPGVGGYIFQGILQRDYPVVQTMLLFYGGSFAVVNLVVDLLYGLVDPRIRYA